MLVVCSYTFFFGHHEYYFGISHDLFPTATYCFAQMLLSQRRDPQSPKRPRVRFPTLFTVLDNLLRDELGVRVAFEALAEAGRFLGEVPGARQGEGVLGECEETREGEPERVG